MYCESDYRLYLWSFSSFDSDTWIRLQSATPRSWFFWLRLRRSSFYRLRIPTLTLEFKFFQPWLRVLSFFLAPTPDSDSLIRCRCSSFFYSNSLLRLRGLRLFASVSRLWLNFFSVFRLFRLPTPILTLHHWFNQCITAWYLITCETIFIPLTKKNINFQ